MDPARCKTFGERLEWARRRSTFTVPALAEKLGISRQALNKVLRDQSSALTAARTTQAAMLLGISTEWLSIGLMPWQRDYHWSPEATELAYLFDQVAPKMRGTAMIVLKSYLTPAVANERIPAAFANPDTRKEKPNEAQQPSPDNRQPTNDPTPTTRGRGGRRSRSDGSESARGSSGSDGAHRTRGGNGSRQGGS